MNQNNKIIYPLDKIFLALELTGVEQYQRCIQDNWFLDYQSTTRPFWHFNRQKVIYIKTCVVMSTYCHASSGPFFKWSFHFHIPSIIPFHSLLAGDFGARSDTVGLVLKTKEW
jgi:hypothetical protein